MPRVLAVADSDSYLKWAAGLLDDLPATWQRRLVVVRTPIAPTGDQVATAARGSGSEGSALPVLTARGVRRLALTSRPDALLLACTGPVVDVLLDVSLAGLWFRPVLVSGLPGVSLPASRKALRYRAGVDLFVVHSRQEEHEYAHLARSLGVGATVGLARLPFLRRRDMTPGGSPPVRDRVLFASQAMVPAARGDRERVLRTLAALAANRPDLRVVVKLRSAADEMQTHRERRHYADLWRGLVAAGEVPEGAVSFQTGPLHEHLRRAGGLVTVSSTAALEAMAMSVPVLLLGDFGVSEDVFNVAFAGSGCVGTLDDLEKADFRMPDAEWCATGYLHEASTWQHLLAEMVESVRAGGLPPDAPVQRPASAGRRHARARLRLAVPPGTYRAVARLSRRWTAGNGR